MPKGAITEYIDVAQLVLYAFWIFFAGLIFYLRREDKREGYPLVYDGPQNRPYLNFPPIPEPKTYLLHDGSTVMAPRPDHEPVPLEAVPTAAWQGAPLTPVGDPMLAAVGPGAYAIRANVADRTYEGLLKIVPLRTALDLVLVDRDPDPRGMTVVGADRVAAGIVSDVWVDRSEVIVRYLEINLGGEPAKHVLVPMTFCDVDGRHGVVRVEAILGSQFANVPMLANPDQVTFQEEDRICAYYGGGTLYATPLRTESIL
jgi:photosynthetic reaction center H subunit